MKSSKSSDAILYTDSDIRGKGQLAHMLPAKVASFLISDSIKVSDPMIEFNKYA